MAQQYRRIAQLRTAQSFREHLASIGAELPFDEQLVAGQESPLAAAYAAGDFTIGNRFAILPMEGWDGTSDGRPTEFTFRRWRHFGESGAKLIWGAEAVAVREDGRANPDQLCLTEHTLADISRLRDALVQAHEARYGSAADLLVGLQLTHSGRFARPYDKKRLDPHTLYIHPILDRKFNVSSHSAIMTDDEIARLIDDFIRAAKLAHQAGFAFVDIKHCHGYLGHEFLSAVDRPGRYGGSFENRTRFLSEVTAGIRAAVPGLQIGVRFSAFDWMPFRPNEDGTGTPETYDAPVYPYAFGGDGTGIGIDLTEPFALLDLLLSLDIRLVCVTAGSPYYNPHIQRPALFPPSDGYQPPEDPLLGVARQLRSTAALKQYRPELLFVGSGYSYLQEWLPHVAQHTVRTQGVDFVGLGRMVLSYPDFPADVLAGRELKRKLLCRTFSDCTTAPRNGMVSGCYPLDDYYKALPEAAQLAAIKARSKD